MSLYLTTIAEAPAPKVPAHDPLADGLAAAEAIRLYQATSRSGFVAQQKITAPTARDAHQALLNAELARLYAPIQSLINRWALYALHVWIRPGGIFDLTAPELKAVDPALWLERQRRTLTEIPSGHVSPDGVCLVWEAETSGGDGWAVIVSWATLAQAVKRDGAAQAPGA